MPGKMERFTQRAREALESAQQAAEQMGHAEIGTEHLLLGLCRDEGSVAFHALTNLGANLSSLEDLVRRTNRAGKRQPDTRLDLSPDTKQALALAVDEARKLGHQYVGTEHLMLALAGIPDSRAVELFKQLGVMPIAVIGAVRSIIEYVAVSGRPKRPRDPVLEQRAALQRRINELHATKGMRQLVSSGTIWEQKYGYSRAVRVMDQVYVSGTTAADENSQIVGVGDPYEQAKFIFRKIERALNEAGAELRHVVRTRVYVTDEQNWEAVATAHGEVFNKIRPANTLIIIKGLVDPRMLVEIEADAIITDFPE